MAYHTRLNLSFVYLLAVVVLSAVAFGASAWTVFPSANPGPAGDTLKSVAAWSAAAWAVGTYETNAGTHTLTERWSGSSWTAVTSPNPGANSGCPGYTHTLNGVAGISANDAWAVGYYTNCSLFRTLIERWNGTAWSVVPSPNPGGNAGNNILYSVSAAAANDVWAAGYYEASNGALQTLVERWNGTVWTVVPSPNPSPNANVLTSIAAVGANDVWAVGFKYDPVANLWLTLTEHWNGAAWTVVPSPNPGSGRYGRNVLNAVAGTAGDVWAVGFYRSSTGALESLACHWNGASWLTVPTPNVSRAYGSANILNGLVPVGAGKYVAVGFFQNTATEHQHKTFTIVWNGVQWSLQACPSPGKAAELNGIALGSNGAVWAVGHSSIYGNDIYDQHMLIPRTLVLGQ